MAAKLLGAVATMALLGFAFPASATIVSVTYTGTVIEINNPDGMFGNPSLGDTVVTKLVFDTSKATGNISDAYSNTIDGGTYWGGPSGFIVSQSIDIGGVTSTLAAPNAGELYAYDGPGYSQVEHWAEQYSFDGVNEISLEIAGSARAGSGAFPASAIAPFSYSGPYGDTYTGITYQDTNVVTGSYQEDDVYAALERVTVSPEPSTWTLMALGFIGLAGSGMRLRRTGASTV